MIEVDQKSWPAGPSSCLSQDSQVSLNFCSCSCSCSCSGFEFCLPLPKRSLQRLLLRVLGTSTRHFLRKAQPRYSVAHALILNWRYCVAVDLTHHFCRETISGCLKAPEADPHRLVAF